MKVTIIDYGAGNIKSIQFALERLGVDAQLTSNPEIIQQADRVIFPGVGEASSAMNILQESELAILIPELKQPVLGICLGMQLLCNSSEEGNTKGIGVFKVDVKKFGPKMKVPQVGWNTINSLKSDLFKGIPKETYMYSVHSFYAELGKETVAQSNYGVEYSAGLRHENFYGVQFHPEKSGDLGSQVISNFLNIS